jgi:hypothetical protein
MLSIEAFAAARRTDQTDMEKTLFPAVADAMAHYPAQGWYNDLLKEVTRLYVDIYHREGGDGVPSGTEAFVKNVRTTLDKTTDPDDTTVDRVSTWLATAILNAATMEAADSSGEFVVMEWVTMHDEDVRHTHQLLDGQQRPPGERFSSEGCSPLFPGDSTTDPSCWMNCRCGLAPVPAELAASMYAVNKEETMTTTETEPEVVPAATAMPWHGVMAPEGVPSGDRRLFTDGSLTHAPLPLPLSWQKVSGPRHDGSVVVAKIEQMGRVGNEYRAMGHFLLTPEADEVIGLVAEFGRFGVSVDADEAEFEFNEDSGQETYFAARIRSGSILPIPAFDSAWVSLGDAPDDFLPDCDPTDPAGECYDPAAIQPSASGDTFKDYDAGQRKKAHTVPGTDSYPIEDCQDLRNAIQAIGRAKNPAATKRHIKTQKARLGCPDVAIPEGWGADADTFDRGPGWITDPEATRRIHDYWTKKGEPGYAKINWGVPGDFNRCRVLVGEKIAANSPEDMIYLNNICAQWHHDALGIWPGRPVSGDVSTFEGEQVAEFVETSAALGLPTHTLSTEPAPGLSLVASGGWCPPSEWFADPCFDAEAPVTVTDEGQVFGHLAGWRSCHTAYNNVCVAPPRSPSGYAFFLTGQVVTTDGPVAVGQITMAGGHAPAGRMRPAISHYDNTCTAVADVACGEDEFGIWVAGAIRPGVTDEQVYALRASALSGDWRRVGIGDEMELIAALAVNSPGFPIPRVGVESGVQVSLVAAGCVAADSPPDLDDVVAAVLAELAARVDRKQRVAALAARIGGGG